MIPIYKPLLDKYKKSAIQAIESEWISNYGIYVDLASESIKSHLNIPFCTLMNNGTSATHALFKALKFKHPDVNKIYLPNNVFIAPYNCALMEYDISQLEIMKIDPETMNIDTSEDYILSLAKNSAVVIVHNLGNIVNVPRLKRLRPDIIFVEDNCEGLFGKYENIYTGSFSGTLASSVSFYGNKTITTGEGGAFFTHDIEVHRYIQCYFSHGMSKERYIHNILGTNYRMTNVQAGFLYDQMSDIEHILGIKRAIFERYNNGLKEYLEKGKLKLLKSEPNTEVSRWMYVLIIPEIEFKTIESKFTDKQIQVRPFFYDVKCHKHLESITCHELSEAPNSKYGIMLPSFPELTSTEQDYIIACLKQFIDTLE